MLWQYSEVNMNDQDKRAIETMAQCGCDLDALCSMFSKVPREDIVAIWNYIHDIKDKLEDSDTGKVSINCS